MKKTILFFSLLGVLVFSGCWNSIPQDEASSSDLIKGIDEEVVNDTSQEEPSVSQAPEDASYSSAQKKGFEIISLNEEWNLYKNYDQGYQIKVPKTSGKERAPVEIEVDGEVTYIYDIRNFKYIAKAKKEKSKYDRASGFTYIILVEDGIDSDQELEGFIQRNFGYKCKLGAKKSSFNEGIFDVGLDMSGAEWQTLEGCRVNGGVVIKYSPEKNKVATWGLGQDRSFIDTNGAFLDQKINDSFEFIN